MNLSRMLVTNMKFVDQDHPHFSQWIKTWQAPSRWEKYDQIQMRNEDVEHLVEQLDGMRYGSSELIVRAALPEFTLVIADPLRVENTVICYRHTAIDAAPLEHRESTGARSVMEPLVDAYVHINNHGTSTDVVVTMGKTTLELSPTRTETASFSKGVWMRAGTPAIVEDEQENMEFYRDMKLIYIAIQKAMYDRPTLFKQKPTVSTPPSLTGKPSTEPKKKHKMRCVKAVRILQIDSEDMTAMLAHAPAPKRPFTCPCWGVIGHWRTYKSGKRVWVKPYTKGQDRNHLELYQAKVYGMVIGGNEQ